MSEFHVEDIFVLTGRPCPVVVGRRVGDFTIGDEVVLCKSDGTTLRGTLDGLDIHGTKGGMAALMFDPELSRHIEIGDVIYSGATAST